MTGFEPGKQITDINVTPMVDIMLVLLIIFMVTATYIAKRAIEVELPEAVSGNDVPSSLIGVMIKPDGSLILNGEAITDEDFKRKVSNLVYDNPDVQAVVEGDRSVSYGRVMEVIDTLRMLGVKRFAATVERKE